MNQKEINELRRRFRPEKSAISRVYGCYVNSSKEIVSDLDESLGMMPQEESEKYLSLLKKGLSGSLGKNLIDIVFSTQQVVDSEEHRLLTTLRDSQLKDNEARQTFYRKVIDSLDMGDSSYLLLLVCDSYDVTHRGKDDSLQADASDEVFTYTGIWFFHRPINMAVLSVPPPYPTTFIVRLPSRTAPPYMQGRGPPADTVHFRSGRDRRPVGGNG